MGKVSLMAKGEGAATNKASLAKGIEATVLRRLVLVGTLVVLVMLGLFLTNISVYRARWYWTAMFPAFALVSIWHELAKRRLDGPPVQEILFRQALHWLGPIVAVRIMFLQFARGQMDADSVALVTLLLLAVTSYLAGVNFERSFIWIGVLLGIVSVIATEIEAFLWLILALAIVALALALTSVTLLRRHKSTLRLPGSP
jgi:hypothetical protein